MTSLHPEIESAITEYGIPPDSRKSFELFVQSIYLMGKCDGVQEQGERDLRAIEREC
jgi:hypothetical protein